MTVGGDHAARDLVTAGAAGRAGHDRGLVTALLPALNGEIGRPDGLLLLAGIAAYTFYAVRRSRREDGRRTVGQATGADGSRLLQAVYAVAGLGLLVLGARWLVDGEVG